MSNSPRLPHWSHDQAGRRPPAAQDPLTRLGRLWKTFEESGAISAYIAYRMHLAQLAYGDGQHVTH